MGSIYVYSTFEVGQELTSAIPRRMTPARGSLLCAFLLALLAGMMRTSEAMSSPCIVATPLAGNPFQIAHAPGGTLNQEMSHSWYLFKQAQYGQAESLYQQ